MQVLWILVSLMLYASFGILVLPFLSSSQDHANTSHTGNNSNFHQSSPKMLSEITLHGFLLWFSMGFLMPVGILAIRMSHREECGRRLKILFYFHSVLEMLAVLLITAEAGMSIKNFDNSFNNQHQRIGLALYCMVWLQALIGFIRPQRGSTTRSVWFFVHWILGKIVSILGVLNIYTGLQAYHEKTSGSIRLWTMLFTIEVSLIVLFYLFQDKWLYIQKQGVILGNESRSSLEQEISQENEKESVIGSC